MTYTLLYESHIIRLCIVLFFVYIHCFSSTFFSSKLCGQEVHHLNPYSGLCQLNYMDSRASTWLGQLCPWTFRSDLYFGLADHAGLIPGPDLHLSIHLTFYCDNLQLWKCRSNSVLGKTENDHHQIAHGYLSH